MRLSFLLPAVLVAGCGDETGSGGSTASASSSRSSISSPSSSGTTAGVCASCDQVGGVCRDGCATSLTYTTRICYQPSPPDAGEFSCDDLLNCSLTEVCYFQAPIGDGCYEHRCVAPPAECANDLTCACLEPHIAHDFGTCQIKNGGAYVRSPGMQPWL